MKMNAAPDYIINTTPEQSIITNQIYKLNEKLT